ncbi:hypothetical protein HDU98_001103 [Podochytrium sp. JEL0797]|nr:hypothetical protein HDU98_001103 [Podochytrium sp. JEL0797]
MAHRIAEVEIKKRLASKQVLTLFEHHLSTLPNTHITPLGCVVQRDVFVDQDGLINASEPKWSVFRIRTAFTVHDRSRVVMSEEGVKMEGLGDLGVKYVATVKSPTVLENGIARTDEDETELSEAIALPILSDPCVGIASFKHPLLDRVITRFSLNPTKGVSRVGEYTTIRSKYRMNCWTDRILAATGVRETPVVELDETVYAFGSAFEIEVETGVPEFVETLLMEVVRDSGCGEVGVGKSLKSKYANFLAGSVDGKVVL